MSTERKTAYPIIALFMQTFGWSKFQGRRAVQELKDDRQEQRLYLAAVQLEAKIRAEGCKLIEEALGADTLPEIIRTVELAKLPGPEADAVMIDQKKKARSRRYEGAPARIRKS